MIKTTTQLFVLTVCVIGMSLLSCKKREIPGPQGDPGTPGIGGNASISSTNSFEVQSSQWLVDTVANYRKATINRPEITKHVIDKGGVKVFIQINGVWSPLPLVQGDLFTQFGYEEGLLHLQFVNIEGGMPAAPATNNFRLVIISEIQ